MIKTAFATCVQIGYSCVQEIYRIGGKLDLLITLNDNKAKDKSGRIYLDDFARLNNIPLLKIDNINDIEVIDKLKYYEIDWLFIIGWSQIAKKQLLETPKKGCIGMHPTLLPEGRGRAAIPWAIIKGLSKTGVTMFKLDEGVDTGDVIAQEEIILNETITATELYDKVNSVHTKLINETWDNVINNRIYLTKQDEAKASVWPGRKPEDGEIFMDMSLKEALTLIRATTHPYPGAYINLSHQKKIIIWQARENLNQGDIKLKDGYLEFIDYEVIGYEEN